MKTHSIIFSTDRIDQDGLSGKSIDYELQFKDILLKDRYLGKFFTDILTEEFQSYVAYRLNVEGSIRASQIKSVPLAQCLTISGDTISKTIIDCIIKSKCMGTGVNQHPIFQNALMSYDECVAIEVPVYAEVEQERWTGHIDALLIHEGKYIIFDLKPTMGFMKAIDGKCEAAADSKEKAATQAWSYMIMANKLWGIPMKDLRIYVGNHKGIYKLDESLFD